MSWPVTDRRSLCGGLVAIANGNGIAVISANGLATRAIHQEATTHRGAGFMDPAVQVRAVQGDTPSVPSRVSSRANQQRTAFHDHPTKPIACHSSHGFEGCSCAPGRELSCRMRALTKECACPHTIRCYRSANVSFSPRGETNSSMRIADRCLALLAQIGAAVLASSARDRARA